MQNNCTLLPMFRELVEVLTKIHGENIQKLILVYSKKKLDTTMRWFTSRLADIRHLYRCAHLSLSFNHFICYSDHKMYKWYSNVRTNTHNLRPIFNTIICKRFMYSLYVYLSLLLNVHMNVWILVDGIGIQLKYQCFMEFQYRSKCLFTLNAFSFSI